MTADLQNRSRSLALARYGSMSWRPELSPKRRKTMPASRFAEWAGTAESRVTKVTRVTHTPNPNISAVLDVGPEVTRVANRKVTKVTASNPSATALTPVTRHPDPGLPKKLIRDQGSNPGNPSNLETKEWPISPNPAADLAWWRDLF